MDKIIGIVVTLVTMVVVSNIGSGNVRADVPRARRDNVTEVTRPKMIVLKPGMLVNPETREVIKVKVERSKPVYVPRRRK